MLDPVIFISCLSVGKIRSVILYKVSSLASILFVPISFTLKLNLTLLAVESTKDFAIELVPSVDSDTYFMIKFFVMLFGSL